MEIRLIDKQEDMPIIQQWANQYGQVLPHVDCLPGVGAMVLSDDGEPLGSAFLYLANDCPVAWIEFVYLEKDIPASLKKTVLHHLYTSLEGCAIAEEHPLLFTGCAVDSIVKMLEGKGWIPASRNMTLLVKHTQISGE
jgi:hypothetical protein